MSLAISTTIVRVLGLHLVQTSEWQLNDISLSLSSSLFPLVTRKWRHAKLKKVHMVKYPLCYCDISIKLRGTAVPEYSLVSFKESHTRIMMIFYFLYQKKMCSAWVCALQTHCCSSACQDATQEFGSTDG